MKTTVRPADVSEADVLAGLVRAAFEEYRDWLVPPSSAHLETGVGIAAQFASGTRAFIAEIDRAEAGCVLFSPKGDLLYFGRLSVLPNWRRDGLAMRLVEAVEMLAQEEGFAGVTLSVRLTLESNQRLFARLGYVEVARQTHPGFTEPTYMDMEKRFA